MNKQFGAKPTKADLARYSQSPQWKGKQFENLVETKMGINIHELPKLLYKQFCEKKGREPIKPLPIAAFDETSFLADDGKAKMVWYGHSALLLRIGGKTIFIDPMMGPNAAPISPFAIKRFSKGTLDVIDDLPEIDLLLMTHDHYDHLDLKSIKRLMPKVKQYGVSLGCKRHLVKWGVAKETIQEFDWWDRVTYNDLEITFTPSRHFSGRGLKDRSKCLWGGWVLKTPNESIWFSGDGGYGEHFKMIGERLGPFDFGIMECGQYNKLWHDIHLFPEESVQAAIDGKVKKAMAVHWGGFPLAQHHWKDPIERFVKAAHENELSIINPQLGEVFSYDEERVEAWWEKFE